MTRLHPARIAALCALAQVFALAGAERASAKPPAQRECIASGPPGQLQRTGSLDHLPTVQLDDGHWAVRMDRREKPTKLQIVSQRGEVRDLKRPRPFTPFQWFGRGTAVYALGMADSLQDGEPNLVLVRWLPGRRPRLITLWQPKDRDAQPMGALNGDVMAVAWHDAEGYHVGTADLERVEVAEAHELRGPAKASWTQLMPEGKGFAMLWASGAELSTLHIDRSGKVGKPARTQWKGAPRIIAAARCGENLYVVEGAKDEPPRLAVVESQAPRELVRFKRFLAPEETQLTCTGDAAVVGRRVWNERSRNIAFWVSTVDDEGNRRDRRVKDMKGDPEAIRMPRLVGSGDALTAFWTEGRGAGTDLYARPIGCR